MEIEISFIKNDPEQRGLIDDTARVRLKNIRDCDIESITLHETGYDRPSQIYRFNREDLYDKLEKKILNLVSKIRDLEERNTYLEKLCDLIE